MSDENNTKDYTLRGLDTAFDQTLTHVAQIKGMSKMAVMKEILIRELTDRIKVFGMTSPLVSALDSALAAHIGAEVGEDQVDNLYGTRWNLEMQELLKIHSDADLQRILMSNTPYITVRADQVINGHTWIPKGMSLWFALFAEVAFSPAEIIHQAWARIFTSNSGEKYYRYYTNINQLREMRHLEPVAPEKNGVRYDGKYCQVVITKPDGYQYGAWHAVITLNDGVTDAHRMLTVLPFPELPNRLFVVEDWENYGSAVIRGEGEHALGFKFAGTLCELDVYSNGCPEDFNPSRLGEVARMLADVVDERLQSVRP